MGVLWNLPSQLICFYGKHLIAFPTNEQFVPRAFGPEIILERSCVYVGGVGGMLGVRQEGFSQFRSLNSSLYDLHWGTMAVSQESA